MLTKAIAGAALIVLAAPVLVPDVLAGDNLDAGKLQFGKSCGVCHAGEPVAPPRQGPNLFGVYGRRAGTSPGYTYSPALAASGVVWNDDTLDRWIENAKAVVPGNNMPYRQADPEKRKLIIEYLKSLKS